MIKPATALRGESKSCISAKKPFEALPTEFGPGHHRRLSAPYRSAWQTIARPIVPEKTLVDNDEAWIGDHCIAPVSTSTGVLLSSRAITLEDPGLPDVPVTLLKEFGVSVPTRLHRSAGRSSNLHFLTTRRSKHAIKRP